ncbi:hypothetical protein ACMFMG_003452 [Clarireedia jacksonii]
MSHFEMSTKKHDSKKEVVKDKEKWEEEAILEIIYRDPESLTDSDLVSTSLSNLAKNLSPVTSATATFNVYLRWLEVHRGHPSQLTLYWPNTIVQWVSSLKARRFTKEDIVSAVEKWRETNGPFKSAKEWDEPRYPPTNSEIGKAFDGHHIGRKDRTSGSRRSRQRESSPQSSSARYRDRSYDKSRAGEHQKLGTEVTHVPANYICNRCGKSANPFQDPSFDREPPLTYTCSLCKKSGKHWFSLCPKNTNRDSLTQKRLAAGIEISGAKQTKSKYSEQLRDNDMPSMIRKEQPLDDQKKSPYLKGYKGVRLATSRKSSQSRSPECASRRKVVDDGSNDDDYFMDGTEDTRFMHSDERNDSSLTGILKETDPYTDEFALNDGSRSLIPGSPTMILPEFNLSFRDTRMSSGTTSSAEDIRTPDGDKEEGFKTPSIREETPEQVYCEFVRNLIEGRAEVVNRRRRRPTALEIWDEDDNRRLQAINFSSTTQISPVSPPFPLSVSFLASDHISDAIVEHPVDEVPINGTIGDLDGQVLWPSELEPTTDSIFLNGADSPASSRYHTPPVCFPDNGDDNTSRKLDLSLRFLVEDQHTRSPQTFVDAPLDLTAANDHALGSDMPTRGTSSMAPRKVAQETVASTSTKKVLSMAKDNILQNPDNLDGLDRPRWVPGELVTNPGNGSTKQQQPLKKRKYGERHLTKTIAKDTTQAKRSKVVDENRKP